MESTGYREKNGLTIKHRNLNAKTNIPLIAEATKREGDLRHYSNWGVILPIEDYWISGEGRTPIIIREVQTSLEGMRKYALLEPAPKKTETPKSRFSRSKKHSRKQEPDFYNVRYVYSEGLDIGKMIVSEEYARVLISLLKEERLRKKQEESDRLGSDIIYIGTVGETEKGYEKVGIQNYMFAVSKIDAQIKDQSKYMREETERQRDEAKKAGMKRRVEEFYQSCTEEEKNYLRDLLEGKVKIEKRKSDDFDELEFYGDEPLH